MKKIYFIITLLSIMLVVASFCLTNILTSTTVVKPVSDKLVLEDSSEVTSVAENTSIDKNADATKSENETSSATDKDTSNDKKAQEILDSMSLDEKINQLFIITPEALSGVDTAIIAGDKTKSGLTQHPVGGLIYSTNNFQNADQTKQLVSKTKEMGNELCKVPLFMSIDEEGGSVARLANSSTLSVPKVDNMSDIGATGDAQKAYEAGKTIATYLSEYGFNLDFAPVADVLTNSKNTVVKDRSFGSDPTMVANMGEQISKALNESNIYSCYKHFPGHGATAGDTHTGFASCDKTYEELEKSELVPFKQAIKNHADFIMVGHFALPKITGDETPASLSSAIIADMLKNKLGYNGLVITDAMNMQALTQLYTSDQIAVKTLQAGADILLMPEDFNLAYTGIKNAVDNGTITEERINESVKKIISTKLKLLKK